MSLIEEAMVPCVLMDKQRISDGEGGFLAATWNESASFDAAIVSEDSTLAQIAEQNGVTGTFSVYTHKNVNLEHLDVFKRVSDGQVFRVKTDQRSTPASTTLNLAKVKAELWNLS